MFYRGLLDWRWRSWAQVADQAARIAERWMTRPTGSTVELEESLDPDGLAADWAALATGLVVRPVSERVDAPWPDVRDRPVRSGAVLATDRAHAGGAWVAGSSNDGSSNDGSSNDGSSNDGSSTEAVRLLRADAFLRAADCFASALPVLPARPIVLLAGSRLDITVRAALTWALREAATIALEPDPEAVVEAALWTRPHLVVASREALARTRTAVRAQKRRWRRLVAVVPTVTSSSDTLSAAEDSAWRRLGIAQRQPVAEALWTLTDSESSALG